VASSTKPVGRIDFVLRILVISALAFALDYLLHINAFSHLNLLQISPHVFRQISILLFYPFVMYAVKAIDGRLLNAGLPHWYSYPAFALWLLSTSIPFISVGYWPIGVALFVLLLIAGCSIPGKQAPVLRVPISRNAESGENETGIFKKFPTRLLVGQVGYLRFLLTFACIWLVLIWLADTPSDQLQGLIAHLGFSIMGFVWLFKVLGRFEDSGRSSNMYGIPYCITMTIISMLALWHNLLNGYETLIFFVLIQVPLALLRSKPRPEEPAPPKRELSEYRKDLELRRKAAKPFLVGPYLFLRRVLVIAFICAPLVYMDGASNHEIGTWIARIGYFMLSFAWIMNVTGRFDDAGWTRMWCGSQYILVVSVASLMPLAVHWVSGYGALAIFVLIQTPMAFLRSKPRPEEPLSEDPLPGSGGQLSSRMSENLELEVSHAPSKIGEASPQQKAPIFTGISSGRDKKTSRWKPY